jgi:phosphotransferase system enzyme I (PtsP)
MVARHMQASVCSIYLFDELNAELVLTATIGLNPGAVGTVRLKVGEGLTGLSVEELRPVCENDCSSHPRYRYFEGLNEEHFDAFCAVPLLRGIRRIGALVVQREKDHPFSEEDTTVMRALANQLANGIENARLILSVESGRHELIEQRPILPRKFLKGKVASPGYALAEAMIERRQESLEQYRQIPARRTISLGAFEQALAETEYELESLQKKVEEKLADGASLIFGAHLLLLKDAQFTGEMTRLIREGRDAVSAVIAVAENYMRLFSQKESAYFREKRDDINDLTRRLLRHMTQQHADSRPWHSRIVIARSLLPSDVLKLAFENVAGIVLVTGGVTSHVSIIARSLHIPLLFCDEPALLGIPEGTRILMDSEQGNIYLDPGQDVIRTFREREKARRLSKTARATIHERTETRDGVPIRLVSNINLLSDLDAALAMKTEGVGLYRSEFPFMIRSTFPTEEEQFVIYRKLDAKMAGREVVFRTLDIGGDKALSYFHDFKENNPFLGMRSIRFAHATSSWSSSARSCGRACSQSSRSCSR